MIFDAHADIWTDVALKRAKGNKNIIKQYHLEKFKKGGINSGIFVIWVDPPYDTNPQKRTMEIIENMSVEIIENQDILKIVKNFDDLQKGLDEGKLSVLIGLEGLSSIGKNIDLINAFYMLGARHASLTWNEQNELATGVKGEPSRGLTNYGIDTVRRLESLGMIVDVSHANEKTFWDICEVASKPFIASHSNSRALCDVPRNLTDEQLKAIAKSGGVVGLNAFKDFVHHDINKQDIEHLANHVDHMVDIMGIDHVGFGFDFCDFLNMDTMSSFASGEEVGTVNFEDASKTQNMIKVFKDRGYSQEDIDKISHGNFFRVIKEILG